MRQPGCSVKPGSMPEPVETGETLLAGRVMLAASGRGLKPTTDTVALAAAVVAGKRDRVLDAGCGSGGAMLCLAARLPMCSVTGLELDPELACLARRNVAGQRLERAYRRQGGRYRDLAQRRPAFRHRHDQPALSRSASFQGTAGSGSLRCRDRDDAAGGLDCSLPETSRAKGLDCPDPSGRPAGRHPLRAGTANWGCRHHAAAASRRRVPGQTDTRPRRQGFGKTLEDSSGSGPSRAGRALHA